MFNNHTMSLVTDLRMVEQDIRNVDFVTVAAITKSKYPELPNVYYAGILIPPTEMLMQWVDGDNYILQNEYPKYLMEKDCDDMIVALLAALTQKNIILYIPQDEFEVYGPILLNHIYNLYGIVCNTAQSQFYIDQTKIPFIISKFYLMDVMDPDAYLATYPANLLLPDAVINKLAIDVHPFNYPVTFDQYKHYFNRINAFKTFDKPKVNMIRPIGENKS